MIFKVLVLGHLLFASAYESKALHELQADVDTLEKTLKGGDMEKRERMAPPLTIARVDTKGAPTTLALGVDHLCAGACKDCRRPGGNPAGTPSLSFATTDIAFVYDEHNSCRCKDVNGNSQWMRAVVSSVRVDSCVHQMNYGQTSWDAAYATVPPSFTPYGFGHTFTWYGCSDTDVNIATVETTESWEEDTPFPPLGWDGKTALPKVTRTATTRTSTWTVAGTNLAHVCWAA